MKTLELEGFLNINKPKGITSYDVIRQISSILKINKIGHSGTLDPLARGVLVVGIGRRATKKLRTICFQDKIYKARLKLGVISDTQDILGKIKKIKTISNPSKKEILKVLKILKGYFIQEIPKFSAKKFKGKKMYELAREGKSVPKLTSGVFIYNIELINYNYPFLDIKIECSTGTYIRAIAKKIGETLKCGAVVKELIREKIGIFKIKDSINLKYIKSIKDIKKNLISLDKIEKYYPNLKVMAFGTFDLLHPGHRFYLLKARQKGDRLIVVVARDLTVKKIKNKFPFWNEKKRLKELKKVKYIDKVVLGDKKDYFKVIKRFNPDILALGYDQKLFLTDKIKNKKFKIIKISAFEPSKYKTSILRTKIDQ